MGIRFGATARLFAADAYDSRQEYSRAERASGSEPDCVRRAVQGATIRRFKVDFYGKGAGHRRLDRDGAPRWRFG